MLNVLEECKGAKKIGISGHVRPDGDCAGSCMALAMYLRKVMIECQVDVLLEEINDTLSVIKGVDDIFHEPTNEIYDVFFVLDGSYDRIGFAVDDSLNAKKKINIDHHISNRGGADIDYIIPTVGSTSELIFELMDESYMDVEIAKAIYIGMIHDTGVFQYSNTSARTLEIAGKLIAYDFDFSKIIEETFYERSYEKTEILGRALLECMMVLDRKCAVACITQRMLNFYQVSVNDLDGIVNQLKQIKGVECAIMLVEYGSMEYKASLRSSDVIDVSKIAMYFGGGGHKKAAGVTMKGTHRDVINNLLRHIDAQLKERTSD
ncbi:MAG: DHH family phosphoesterase [Eubacteriales bacterium]